MKTMKKAFALVLALAIVMSLGITAFADPAGAPTTPEYKITVTNKISTSNASIAGKTFSAYKLFDVDINGTAYAYSVAEAFTAYGYDHDGDKSAVNEKGSNGNPDKTAPLKGKDLVDYVATLTGAEHQEDLYKFARDVYTWAEANALAAKQVSSEAALKGLSTDDEEAVFTLTPNGQNDKYKGPGYYLVFANAESHDGKKAALTSALILDTTNPAPSVAVKLEAPTLDKKVDGAVKAPAEIGSTVTYTLTSKVPAGFDGFDSYRMDFIDKLDAGLTLVDDSFTVSIKNTQIKVNTATSKNFLNNQREDCYVWVDADTNGFTLRLPDLTLPVEKKTADAENHITPAAGDDIVVTYKATLGADAVNVGMLENTAHLEYSNNPMNSTYETPNTNPENPGPDLPPVTPTPDDKAAVYNFALDIYKYKLNGTDPSDTTTKVAGAGFKLYKVSTGKNVYYKYDTSTNKVTWVESAANADERISQGETGLLDVSFKGLVPGTYYLEETTTPANYNKLEHPIKVEIQNLLNAQSEIIGGKFIVSHWDDAAGDYVAETFAGDAEAKETARKAAQDKNFAASKGITSRTVNVANSFGSELPSTGGVGTTIFYVGGAMLMVAALVLLITKKKMSAM